MDQELEDVKIRTPRNNEFTRLMAIRNQSRTQIQALRIKACRKHNYPPINQPHKTFAPRAISV